MVLEVCGIEFTIPDKIEEMKLSEYIEYNDIHSNIVNTYNESKDYTMVFPYFIDAIKVFNPTLNLDDLLGLTLSDYEEKSIEEAIANTLVLINSVLYQYEAPNLMDKTYTFNYKGEIWKVPLMEYWSGESVPDLKYGQYIEVKSRINEFDKKKDKDLSDMFTCYLGILGAIAVKDNEDFPNMTAREYADKSRSQSLYFKDIDAKTGLDASFFLMFLLEKLEMIYRTRIITNHHRDNIKEKDKVAN